jgi:hypothetical protein
MMMKPPSRSPSTSDESCPLCRQGSFYIRNSIQRIINLSVLIQTYYTDLEKQIFRSNYCVNEDDAVYGTYYSICIFPDL